MGCPVTTSCRAFGYMCFDCCGDMPLVDAIDSEMPLHYKKFYPTDPEHPVVAFRNKREELTRKSERARRASTPFKTKSKLVRKSFKTEGDTRTAIIRATARSGALNGDGDSRIGDGQWGIDDKLCSNAVSQFTVSIKDVSKAHAQHCVIVITLKDGSKYVVAELEDFCSAAESLASSIRLNHKD